MSNCVSNSCFFSEISFVSPFHWTSVELISFSGYPNILMLLTGTSVMFGSLRVFTATFIPSKRIKPSKTNETTDCSNKIATTSLNSLKIQEETLRLL